MEDRENEKNPAQDDAAAVGDGVSEQSGQAAAEEGAAVMQEETNASAPLSDGENQEAESAPAPEDGGEGQPASAPDESGEEQSASAPEDGGEAQPAPAPDESGEQPASASDEGGEQPAPAPEDGGEAQPASAPEDGGEAPRSQEGENHKYSIRLPKRGKVADAAGKIIGKIRKSVWYDADKNEQGEFRKEDANVYFYREQKLEGYVDKHDNILTMDNVYVASIRRLSWLPILLLVLILLLATVLSVALSAYYLTRSDDYAPVLFIADEDGVEWHEEENLPVFYNERFGDTVIAPGMYGSYRFMLRNDNEDALLFSLDFAETNEYGIGLCYRLKRDGVYLSDEETFTATEQLGVDRMTIEPDSASLFELEWYWSHNDPVDTVAGESGATYTLHITFTASVIG